MQIIPLSEGCFSIDQTKVFVPFNKENNTAANKPAGSILVEIQPFVIITSKDIILIDTGLGYLNENGEPQLLANLHKAGINPSQITKVLISHLHKDHAGGITIKNPLTDERFISFPYANYYVQKREFNKFIAAATEDFQILEDFSKLIWLNDNEGLIDGYIKYQVTGGHSIFHQVFWIEENNQTIFFGGDVAPQLQQMKSRFVAKYDVDGKKCMELRQQWWEEGSAEAWTFLFYHDIATPFICRTA
jgi:glyoxylase-like metal-dependent hydrolase (beta-lactamase superfamily II)